ncbi:RNA 3'-terminal phosphate cyclase-like protein isoform X2 [Numida meleagris]|uniref:RNA 3'-terminal phosphate cyclase-like protein isoform X2 n=1 Tax=Numida meleagris TaxID=8996 RepID=UPI000B3DE79F|nr:RNA 3'-terminal phosphate cyclase-like protein isoform X2 [Numida meleagris]
MLGAPGLHIVVQVGHHQYSTEEQNHLPLPAGHSPLDEDKDVEEHLSQDRLLGDSTCDQPPPEHRSDDHNPVFMTIQSMHYPVNRPAFRSTSLQFRYKAVVHDHVRGPVRAQVDVLKATALPLLKKFGIDGESLEIKINRRGMPPKGGGEILFACPVRKVLQPIQFTDPGKIKRIRGTAYSVRVSPQMANRMVESARSVLNKFLPDIYIYTDHMKGISSGNPCRRICNSMGRKDEFPFPHWWCMSISTAAVLPYSASPGFGICLIAETINGTILSAELASNPQGQGAAVLPEELGQNCAKLLLEEIYRGGCVDSTNQSLALLLMTLGQQDVSKVLLGPLSPYTIEFLRHLRSFFQIMFKIEMKSPEEERKGGEKVLMTCVGIGFSNLSKTIR